MWSQGWRESAWQTLSQDWDIIIVGGGITGAGVFREATRRRLRAVLIEQRDFAWGTSSRSSKLVHGGLRYLKEGRFRLTRLSVHEREQLLREGPGLVEPLPFLLANYDQDSSGRLTYGVGLTIYDLLALRWSHRYYNAQDFRLMAGQITQEGLEGGYRYGDAKTDDARLVLRLLWEAVADGGLAMNYVKAMGLLRDEAGTIRGIEAQDMESGEHCTIHAPLVINATGAWADYLRAQVGARPVIRPLRGSHLIFPSWRLPAAQAISFAHPQDGRPVFLFPWEGVTLVGTTDVDCHDSLDEEPQISGQEVAYLMAAVEARFPLLDIGLDDVISTFAGIRPVIGSGKLNPSEESRDHVIWEEDGLLTVTGGKLTTFRLVALELLKRVRQLAPAVPEAGDHTPMLEPVDEDLLQGMGLDEGVGRRLRGRYGQEAAAVVSAARAGELENVPGTPLLWVELRWAARAEGVVHLDDLLLRRTRLGLLLGRGGHRLLPRIREICQAELGWDDARWETEEAQYLSLWARCYALPTRATIPAWKQAGATSASAERAAVRVRRRQPLAPWKTGLPVALATLLLAGVLLALLRRHLARDSSAVAGVS